jgi:hypothetical protein
MKGGCVSSEKRCVGSSSAASTCEDIREGATERHSLVSSPKALSGLNFQHALVAASSTATNLDTFCLT